ncbi:GNAT family N-acetyltransferase [Myxococcota bacterium]|nr:GNAT family N-acetyltransferase [Myxococcota bacterium]
MNKVTHPREFAPEWDTFAQRYYQKRSFLAHCHDYNPCNQRYYELYDKSGFRGGCCVYSLVLDVFTFTRIRSPLRMNIIGIPASVGVSGVFGQSDHDIEDLLNAVIEQEKGLTIGLNFEKTFDVPQNSVWGKTLPTLVCDKSFDSFEKYIEALRSPYRRRLFLARKKMQGLHWKRIRPQEFTHELYGLYLQVFEKSEDKLEKLTLDFFRNLPDDFSFSVIETTDARPLAFNCVLKYGQEFDFFMGGIDYEFNEKHQLYFNITADVVSAFSGSGCSLLDFGQTAEVPKSRLGGKIKPLYMFAFHQGLIARSFFRLARPLLEYHKNIELNHVFREEV